ncbi:MAG: DUF3467 domain-containing protein [Acidimicrobiales bacterium]
MSDATPPSEPDPSPGPAINIAIHVPEELRNGVYADFLSVWHSAHDFTLDFCVTDQPMQDPEGNVTTPCRVVARVKVPLTLADDVLRALADNVSRFEDMAGPIHKPGELNRPNGPDGLPGAV